ncbi:uncharacterized protein [Venturia canescens]|nr:uncharacterized protein LOC122414807 [Venturia canescens]XP_043282519.1 uncharacterized protein LOC122414917 isoform X1 [Venturia canescens]XP_043282684.1 uncharacterized protein LOC122415001 isoform X1 [Venturia canescens]XP_043282690.1 uncharacterized protein LOC122415006 isoform X1 [Venturia canescens]XP_043282692.1 uncharacterized protein LOC122415007 isoform X1 [Venturia canescens]XP_043282698.1 uncharacterized protein LOC122415010 isoform X1 [Venturia canescens]XP_043282700.1 unchara
MSNASLRAIMRTFVMNRRFYIAEYINQQSSSQSAQDANGGKATAPAAEMERSLAPGLTETNESSPDSEESVISLSRSEETNESSPDSEESVIPPPSSSITGIENCTRNQRFREINHAKPKGGKDVFQENYMLLHLTQNTLNSSRLSMLTNGVMQPFVKRDDLKSPKKSVWN